MLPAVVAAAVVEVDQPDAFDVDAQAHHRLRPALHDALLVVARGFGQRVHFIDRVPREPLHFGQQRGGVFIRENLFAQRRTSASQRSNFSRTFFASATLSERSSSRSVFSIFFFSSSTFFSKVSFPSRFQSGTFAEAEASSASMASSFSSAARFTFSISG